MFDTSAIPVCYSYGMADVSDKVLANRARAKAWAEANPERARASARARYAANAELRKAQIKAWRQANPEMYQAQRRRIRTRRSQEFYERNTQLKLERGGCVDCGLRVSVEPVTNHAGSEAHHTAFDWDHEDPTTKEFRFAVIAQGGPARIALLEAEVAKCSLRCAPCHRLRHWLDLRA